MLANGQTVYISFITKWVIKLNTLLVYGPKHQNIHHQYR
jgi:hypothetical protein